MFNWCKNRLEVTGKSVYLDVMQQWITGTEAPGYRQAIHQAIRLFLAGCAGVFKPTRATEYLPYPALVAHGTGNPTPQNMAFQSFVELLRNDVWLTGDVQRQIERLYTQSGLAAVTWPALPENVRSVMAQEMAIHAIDWFGPAGYGMADAGTRWEQLGMISAQTCPCDMLMILPPNLVTELNGNSGIFRGISGSASLYQQIHGMVFPAGQNVEWKRHDISCLTLMFDTPWYPPSNELMGDLSSVFDCEIRHSYREPVNGIEGYDCYDRGDHVDSGSLPEPLTESGSVSYLADNPSPPVQTILRLTSYGERRA